ncbi:hypothetical protein BVG19_g462 [[Candida] boidinii]|nr:hypothetical protein BVG19_g462 [[Candida] boidinii]OWB50255.1 hypothetical protein B5S27_g1803 [[Candida] boidinii]
MSFELQALGHPTSDLKNSCIFLRNRLTGKRYAFGHIPEGFQRKCNDSKIKVSKTENVFLTGNLSWDSINGLPGFILTVSDQGLKELGLFHCSDKNPILEYVISCWRYFVYRFGLNLNVQSLSNEEIFDSGEILVQSIGIKPDDDNDTRDKQIDYDKETYYLKLKKFVSLIFPIKVQPDYQSKTITNIELPKDIKNVNISSNYIITPKSVRGKFIVQKAKELGCQVPHFKKLCNNESVTLDNGTIITPEQVLEPTRKFKSVLIIDIPTVEHFKNTLNFNWDKYSDNYGVIYYFISESIENPLKNKEFVEFLSKFDSNVMQFISYKDYVPNSINYDLSFKLGLKWRSLLKDYFPLINFNNEPKININELIKDTKIENYKIFPFITGQELLLKSGDDGLTINDINGKFETMKDYEKVYDDEIKKIGFSKILSKEELFTKDEYEINEDISGNCGNRVITKDDVETVVLGTGSALPSRLRNVLSNIVRIPHQSSDGKIEYKSIVLDGGENTLGSIIRLFDDNEYGNESGGYSKLLKSRIEEIKLVYLSHLHADHHIGLGSLISEWCKLQLLKPEDQREKLYLVTPWQFEKFLKELSIINNSNIGSKSRGNFIDMGLIEYFSCDEFNLRYNDMILPEMEQVKFDDVRIEDIGKIKNKPILVKQNDNYERINKMIQDLHILKFETCYAHHCEYSYSCSITFNINENSNENFKISYSGDTRPTFRFTKIGFNSDLLIHESTLDDVLIKDAIGKCHSTTSEAIRVGALMNCRKIILTHFSQRYRIISEPNVIYGRLIEMSQEGKRDDDDVQVDENIDKDIIMTDSVSNITNISSGETIIAIDKLNEIAIDDGEKIKVRETSESMMVKDRKTFEEKSSIFRHELTDGMKENCLKMELITAYDNMIIKYRDMNKQKELFELEGDKLNLLFENETKEMENENEEEGEDELNEVVENPRKESKKKNKKNKKLSNINDNEGNSKKNVPNNSTNNGNGGSDENDSDSSLKKRKL